MSNRFEDLMARISFDSNGLVGCIVQEAVGGRVIMFAWMNRESLGLTIKTGEMHFWSRSRQELWHKGASSGNTQKLVSIEVDCDGDALLAKVRADGPACHLGTESCFDTYRIAGDSLGA